MSVFSDLCCVHTFDEVFNELNCLHRLVEVDPVASVLYRDHIPALLVVWEHFLIDIEIVLT